MIAAYTLVDKVAVAAWLIPPLVQDWAANLGRVVLMTPMALKARAELAPTWRRAWKEIVGGRAALPALLHPRADRDGLHAGKLRRARA